MSSLYDIFLESYTFTEVEDKIVCVKYSDNTEYFLTKDTCTCKGFKFRGNCKHLSMWNGTFGIKDVSLAYVRKELKKLYECLGLDFEVDIKITTPAIEIRVPKFEYDLFAGTLSGKSPLVIYIRKIGS